MAEKGQVIHTKLRRVMKFWSSEKGMEKRTDYSSRLETLDLPAILHSSVILFFFPT